MPIEKSELFSQKYALMRVPKINHIEVVTVAVTKIRCSSVIKLQEHFNMYLI